MGDWFDGVRSTVFAWVSANAVWIGFVSIVYFVVSLFAVRFLIVRMPPDYFIRTGSVGMQSHSRISAIVLKIGKNLGGIVVILIGLIMSIPGVAGQGFLTILLGLSLTDFPGKRSLELRIIRQPFIFRTIASIREKAGKSPFEMPVEASAPEETGSGGNDAS